MAALQCIITSHNCKFIDIFDCYLLSISFNVVLDPEKVIQIISNVLYSAVA